MELEQARKRAEELRVIIEKNNRLYYDQDAPELEDFEYDALNRELKQIEAEYPELVTASSPTQHVGGTASSKFSKVTHAVKMESLQDAFSFDELREFDTRVREAGIRPEYVVEAKIDGLSVSLEYRMGQLVRGSTRGDGVVGEDVTENIMTIKDIPHELPDAPDFLEVRGEVYMPHSAFFKLKEQQELEDKTPFKNPRNAAAGSLRQKDSKITAERGLSIFVFNLQQCEGRTFKTHRETLDYIKSLGFPVSPRYSVFENIEDAIKEIEAIGEARGTLELTLTARSSRSTTWPPAAPWQHEQVPTVGHCVQVSARGQGKRRAQYRGYRWPHRRADPDGCVRPDFPCGHQRFPREPAQRRYYRKLRRRHRGHHQGAQGGGHRSRRSLGVIGPSAGQQALPCPRPARAAAHPCAFAGRNSPALRQPRMPGAEPAQPHPLCVPQRHGH